MNDQAPSMRAKPDFPDWLSPMLVKELRQGMRSRVFLFSFLALQVAMIFPALIGLLNASQNDSIQSVTGFFWTFVSIPLVIAMPFSGLGAISREKAANTLEPIFLTRLTSRRIVSGKWVAIVTQTLLLVTAILPYAVLRYFLGSVNLASEMEALAWLVAVSALLTSVAVGVSPVMGRFGRIVVPILTIVVLYFGTIVLVSMTFNSPVTRGSGWQSDWQTMTATVIQACCLLALMLETGAGRIAPAAENHSSSKRLVALVSVLTATLYSYTPGAPGWMWLPALFIAGPAMIGAMCEPVREVPSVYRPFVKRGFVGRVIGRLFYPGWPAGFFFCLLLLCIAGFRIDQIAGGPAYIMSTGSHVRATGWHITNTTATHFVWTTPSLLPLRITELAVAGMLFVPMSIFRLARLRMPLPSVFYFGFQIIFSLLSLLGVMTTEYSRSSVPSSIESILACIPPCTLWYHSRIHDWDAGQQLTTLTGLLLVTGFAMLALIVRMWPAWRAISTLEKTAASLAPAESPPDAARPAAAA